MKGALTVEQLRDRLNLEIEHGNAAKPVVYVDRELGMQPAQTTLPLPAGLSFADAPKLEEDVVVLA